MDIVTLGAAVALSGKKLNDTIAPVSASDAGKIATVDSNGKYQATALTVGQGEVAVDSTLLVSGAAADAKVTGDKVNELKSALNKLRHIEPSKVNGIVFTGNLITYNSYIVSGKFVDVYNGKIRWNNGSYNTYVIPIDSGKQYSFSTTSWWVITDSDGAILDSCGSAGVQKNTYDTTGLTGASYFIVSISTSTANPVFKETDTSSTESNAEIQWLKVTEENISNLNLINRTEFESIPSSNLKDAENLGDLIQFESATIVENKYVWGVTGNRVNISNNSNLKYSVVSVVPGKVYRFPTVSWWALTDENDTVVLGCGSNGTSTNHVDTTGYATAAKLYVTFSKTATAYIIDNTNGVTDYSWTLDGFSATANNNVFAIPNFKHITGDEWNLYFDGAWLRNAEYKRTSNGAGQYSDHFSYESSSAGQANSTIRLYDNNFDMIGSNTMILQYESPNYRNLSALFIGDSTINQNKLTQQVLDTFIENNVVCTLLGTMGSGDNKHEGRSGWTANDYCGGTTRGKDTAQNPFYNPSTEAFDFAYYMSQQSYSAPDFVFIQLGINDMFSVSMAGFDAGYNAFKTNMLSIIESIHNYNSSIKIVVNLIIMPNGNISAYNTLYGTSYYNWERRYVDILSDHNLISDLPNYVLINPHNLILDPMTMIRDDVHPTDEGYVVLGTWDANFMFAN